VSRPQFTPDGWVFLVLTLDMRGHYVGGVAKWETAAAAFRDLSRLNRNFLTILRRYAKKNGWRNPASNWVAVVEAHRTGNPHLNLMVYSPELAAQLASEREYIRAQEGTRRQEILLRGDLLCMAMQAGWGAESTAERVESLGKLNNYMVKLAGEGGQTSHELAKLSQVPRNAPKNFRRLRSGKGFLKPKHKSETMTGTMIRRVVDYGHGQSLGAIPLQKPSRFKRDIDRYMAGVCCGLEGDRLEREYNARKLGLRIPDEESFALDRAGPDTS